ncbi:MAG TPA: fumarylacetoacetate hydrolase family protein, partial [Burkholderiales bacterium]
MRIVNFSLGHGAPRPGLLVGEQVFEAPHATVRELLTDIAALRTTGKAIPVKEVKLHAPLLYPGAIYCAGANYADHVEEMARAQNLPPPKDPRTLGLKPWFFLKPPRACVVGPLGRVARPRGSLKLDWEAELAAVIGRAARNVPVEKALDHVAGYTIANDLSARDLSRRAALPPGNPFYFDWTAHKGFEGSCPLGPWITPASEIPDPQRLTIRLWVNGALKQDSNSSRMIFSTAEQISHLSSLATLHP